MRPRARRRRASRDVDLLRVPRAELRTCYLSGRRVIHKPHCTVGHPKCRWRRKEAGQVVCDCPAYGFPHRQGSGLCGQQIYGKWRRPGVAADPERAYTTLTSRGRKERFGTLKRAMEHAHMIADHERVHVDVLLGSKIVSHVRPRVARDAKVPLERRAESRTLDIFTGRTKAEEGAKGRHDWKGEAQKMARELAECRRTGRDPSPRLRRFQAWHKKAMAEKREDFRTATGNVVEVSKALLRGGPAGVVAAVRSGKLKTVRTPIGGFQLKMGGAEPQPRRLSRDSAAPLTKRSAPPPADASLAATSRLRPGSKASYVREVMMLMRSGHGLATMSSVRLIAKWERLIDTAWRSQKTACWTADHIVKYDARGMCPCTGSGRDCARCATKGRR